MNPDPRPTDAQDKGDISCEDKVINPLKLDGEHKGRHRQALNKEVLRFDGVRSHMDSAIMTLLRWAEIMEFLPNNHRKLIVDGI